jgi:hypothetical protein
LLVEIYIHITIVIQFNVLNICDWTQGEKMKKTIFTLLATLAIFSSTSSANAAMLNFDDINDDIINETMLNGQILDGYGGFNWQLEGADSWVFHKGFGYPGFTALQGVTSGNFAAYTNHDFNHYFVITSTKAFDFTSAYFTSLALEHNNISIEGFIGTNTIAAITTSFDVSNSIPTFFEANGQFNGINKLVISSTLDNPEGWIAMDDFNYNPPAAAPAPEPSSMILGLMGLGSMLGLRRKK